ncbi:MAG: lipopolysaccharide biosynthesis protein [Bradyrhizobiaceae bacterium]|nr:MAG: lipopolysaccharide biosynthesis protein [Bradyrhizobiaceae bacterium]
MRLAVWRDRVGQAGKSFAKYMMTPAAPPPSLPDSSKQLGDIDLRAIWQALVRQRKWVIVPTAAVFVLAMIGVNVVTPKYKSEARILIDGRENVFLRPTGERGEERTSLDAEAVTSQVQLLLSRDLALEVIKKNRLDQLPEFDPVLRGVSPLRTLLVLFGFSRDPFGMTPEERVLNAYYERLTAYAVDKSRVMVVEFLSRDPELAARVANSIADEYLVFQQAARQEQAKAAGQWLSGEIDGLRKKVAEAEDRVEAFRSKSNLFIGTNSTSLSNQQLGELNTQLNNARAAKSDAESRARAIREMLQAGKPIEASEVLNSELVRRLAEQRVTLRAQLAEQSSTLLDQHPRIKELKAQIADLERQMRDEASKISRSLDNDARIASARVDGLTASLDQLKKQATSNNAEDVQLRALEREAKAQRDLLETYLAKYREATTRETIDSAPADGRIISRAIVSNTPAYPKKLPIVLIATLATLLLTSGYIVTAELLRMTAPRAGADILFEDEPLRRIEPRISRINGINSSPDPGTDPGMDIGGSEIGRLAESLQGVAGSARKITVIGAKQDEGITLTALTLARLLAQNSKAVLVDLSMASPTLKSISIDPATPGLTDLMTGRASFGQVITRDRFSGLHLVGGGREPDRAVLQSPRLGMAIDALLRAYDYVVLDTGTAADLPAALIASQAHAVIVPASGLGAEARAAMRDQLLASGFVAVTILDAPAAPAPRDTEQTVAA